MSQGCNYTNHIVISWLDRTCWNNLATSPIISTRLSQVVNSERNTNLLTTWDKQCEHNFVDDLLKIYTEQIICRTQDFHRWKGIAQQKPREFHIHICYSRTLSSIVEILSQFDVGSMQKLKHKSYFRRMDLLLRKHKVSIYS
jgi:hypothetical protein